MLSAEGALFAAGDGPILVLLLCLEWCFLWWSGGVIGGHLVADWGVLWWCSAGAWGF